MRIMGRVGMSMLKINGNAASNRVYQISSSPNAEGSIELIEQVFWGPGALLLSPGWA